MKMKAAASLAFLLNTLLFGSYYSIAKEMLGRVDPIVFNFFVMMTLVPPAIVIIACSWRQMTRQAVKSGFLLGSCLCLGLCMLAVALKYNSATGTAFFPSLNGLLAALFSLLVLRKRISKATWFASFVSVAGAVLLMLNASMGGARGALIAFIGSLFCTFYIFLADHEQKDQAAYWPLFGVELLTMALWANLITLLFGDWRSVHVALPKDILVILYIGLGTTLLPTLITVLLQKYISPVTVSFISILEPILGALVAYFYLHEVLPLDGYLGAGLIVAGAVIHTWGSVDRSANKLALRHQLSLTGQRMQASLFGALATPILCCAVGVFIVYKLGGFPPTVWRDLYALGPQIPALIHRGQAAGVLLLGAQAVSWLVAWISLLLMGGLATYRMVTRFFFPPRVAAVDMRVLKQMGYTPRQTAASRRKKESPLVQRRRKERRERLLRLGSHLSVLPAGDLAHLTASLSGSAANMACAAQVAPGHVHHSAKVRLVAFAETDTVPTSALSHTQIPAEESPSYGEQYHDALGHWAYWPTTEEQPETLLDRS